MSPAPTQPFHQIYRTELQYVANLVRRLGVGAPLVEDLTHDIFLAAYRRHQSYDPTRPIRPWLTAFAFKRVSAFRERAQARYEVPHAQLPEVEDTTPSAEHRVAARQSRELVLRALEALDLEKRAIFVLVEIDGCPVPEVAEALGIPLNTAYSRLRRGRELFEVEVSRLQKAGAP
jgi:RNA polymerase sigma-70 factor (ECF subfamily)